MLHGTETAARLICAVRLNCSERGKLSVHRYASTTRSMENCHTSRSRYRRIRTGHSAGLLQECGGKARTFVPFGCDPVQNEKRKIRQASLAGPPYSPSALCPQPSALCPQPSALTRVPAPPPFLPSF